MNLSDQLEELEGRVRHAYKDTEGYWTIGVGRLIDKRKGGGLSDDEIDYLKRNDIEAKTTAVRSALPWMVLLNEPRQAVLIGMAFQMGVEGLLGFRNTLRAVKEHRWADAANGMLRSKWATQTPERALKMANQMKTGAWQT